MREMNLKALKIKNVIKIFLRNSRYLRQSI